MQEYKELFKQFTDAMSQDPHSEEAQELKARLNELRQEMGLLSFAQIEDLKPIKELKPLKYPGDKEPTQQETRCTNCGATLNENDTKCRNCGVTRTPFKGQAYQAKPTDPGPKPNPFSTNVPRYIQPGRPVAASRIDDEEEEQEEREEPLFESDVFNQCETPHGSKKRQRGKIDDKKLDAVWKSCIDLGMD